MPTRFLVVLALALAPAACGPGGDAADAGEMVEVAAAANLAPVLDTLVAAFGARTGVPVRVTLGGTGQLYAQIRNGAPFHVLLAADAERPRLLEEERFAVRGTRRTYAFGRLVFYAPGEAARLADAPWAILRRPGVRVAVANPRTAPYGVAALETLDGLRAAGELGPVGVGSEPAYQLVTGENVGQTFQFVRSGAAEAGFVALSQVRGLPADQYVPVPVTLHAPVRQDAVLLAPAAAHPGARAFLDFLASDEARAIFRRFGYEPGPGAGGGS